MRVCKRILGGLTLLLSTAGMLAGLAGGVGIWILKAPVTARATQVSERTEAAFDLADLSLDQVKASLTRASVRLESVKEEQRKTPKDPPRGNTVQRLMARTVQQRISPELGDAHEKFHLVAEAVVVVNSILEDVGDLPLHSISGLDVDRLSAINSRLSQVEASAWELVWLLGEPEANSDAIGTEFSRIEQVLITLQGLISEFGSRVTEVRQRVEVLKSRTFAWITPATILISESCFWIAVSQISLLARAWSWLRR
jgi:hypothetical protein